VWEDNTKMDLGERGRVSSLGKGQVAGFVAMVMNHRLPYVVSTVFTI
jgi:hypothetical protein